METLTVSGVVTNNGSTLTNPISLTLTVNLERADTGFSQLYAVSALSDSIGRFSVDIEIEDDIIDRFTVSAYGASGIISISMYAHAFGAREENYSSAVVAIFSFGQTFIGIANEIVDDLKYDIDLSGLTHYNIVIAPRSDSVTQDAFGNIDSIWCELWHQESIFGIASIRYAIQGGTGFRSGNPYTAHLYLDSDELDPEFFVRSQSEGTDFLNDVIVRTMGMAGRSAFDDFYERHVYVIRIDEYFGIGSISSEFEDRIFEFPFIIRDMDLDIEDNKLRIRGDISIGFGKTAAVMGLGNFDGRVRIEFKDREKQAFTKDELKDLFDVDVVDLDYDILPGTDIDELPWWFWVCISPLFPRLSGVALIIAALEALATPIIRNQMQEQIEDELSKQVKDYLEGEIEGELNPDGSLDDETVENIKSVMWFEGDDVAYDVDGIQVTGWAGLSGQYAYTASLFDSDSCPFSGSDDQDHDNDQNGHGNQPGGDQPGGGQSTDNDQPGIGGPVEDVFRDFERTLSIEPLEAWMREYKAHRFELSLMSERFPELQRAVEEFAVRNQHVLRDGLEGELPASTVREFATLRMKVAPKASSHLNQFLKRIEDIFMRTAGRRLDEVVEEGVRQAPTDNRQQVLPLLALAHILPSTESGRKPTDGNSEA